MNRAEYAPTAPPGYATFGSELTETDNEPPFRVFKFFDTKNVFFRWIFPFSGGNVRSPAPPGYSTVHQRLFSWQLIVCFVATDVLFVATDGLVPLHWNGSQARG